MAGPDQGPRAATASELTAQLEAERQGVPFVVYRDSAGEQCLIALGEGQGPVSIGRRPTADVCLDWDGEVSGLHAQLEPAGGEWTLVDDGLSRNGSYVNGERVRGRRRLRERDMLRFGSTSVLYRAPADGISDSTVASTGVLTAASLSDAQRRVLIALCRPFKDSSQYATPATNQQIAAELFVSVEAVKSHLRALFGKFEVDDLPQNTKRLALAERAMKSGLVSEREL